MFGKVRCGLNFDKLALQLWNLHPGTQVKRVFMLAFPLLLADTFPDSSQKNRLIFSNFKEIFRRILLC